jgi:hypothetical protein
MIRLHCTKKLLAKLPLKDNGRLNNKRPNEYAANDGPESPLSGWHANPLLIQNVGWISAAHPPIPFGRVVTRNKVDARCLSTLQSKEAMQYEPVSTRRCTGRYLLFYGGDL